VFDAHVHIVDPRFPLTANEGFRPAPFTVADYRERMSGYGVEGGAVVSGSFQGTDQTYLRAALPELGPGWVGVTQLDPAATDEDIAALHADGVRALRFNIVRGRPDLEALTALARRAHEVAGWHAELYVDSARLPALERVLSALPRVSIDHLGLSAEGLGFLLSAVDRGARVKASGFGRVRMNISETLHRVHRVNPEALMFGTDLPGTRAPRAFEEADLELIAESVGDDLDAVLRTNAQRWYRLTD
jgi:predicted TIM-barrel fold metal-dependent hydrolase